MPALIYGTAWKKERTTQLVEQAVLTGFRGIDTACQVRTPQQQQQQADDAAALACVNRHQRLHSS